MRLNPILRALCAITVAFAGLTPVARAQSADPPILPDMIVGGPATGQVAGQVMNDCDGDPNTTADRQPAVGVDVMLRRGGRLVKSTMTDASGRFSFVRMRSDNYEVVLPAVSAALPMGPVSAGSGAVVRLNPQVSRVSLAAAQVVSDVDFVIALEKPEPMVFGLAEPVLFQGAAPSVLTIAGEHFTACSVIRIDGEDRPTTFLSATQVSTRLRPSDLATEVVKQVGVFTPGPGGGLSATSPLSVVCCDKYVIKASAGANGTIEPSGDVKVERGKNQKFVITPNPSATLGQVFVNNQVVTPTAISGGKFEYEFKDVKSNQTISANFVQDLKPSVCALPASEYITTKRPKVRVPIVLQRTSNQPIRLFSIDLSLTDLRAAVVDIREGGFLRNGAGAGARTSFNVLDRGNGNFTVDGILIGYPCGSTSLKDTLFTVDVSSGLLNGAGSLKLNSVALRDCDNAAIALSAAACAPCEVQVDQCPPTIAVQSPNGGERYSIASAQTIRWSATDLAGIAANSIRIDLSTDGGANWSPLIASGLANSGSHPWSVNALPTVKALVRIAATDNLGNEGSDVSDSLFTILQPSQSSLTLNTAEGGRIHMRDQSLSAKVVNKAPIGTPAIPPTGKVELYDGATLLASGMIGADGSITFADVKLPIGGHALKAKYLGDAAHEPSEIAAAAEYVVKGELKVTMKGNGTAAQVGSPTISVPANQTRFFYYLKGDKPMWTLVPTTALEFKRNRVKSIQLGADFLSPLRTKVSPYADRGPGRDADPSDGADGNDSLEVVFEHFLPLADLCAKQLREGNDRDGNTRIQLTWADSNLAGLQAIVYRKGFGNYPMYDKGTTPGSIPTVDSTDTPTTLAGKGWTLTDVKKSGDFDEPTARDFYYYVAFAVDSVQNWHSKPSPVTVGTLNYHLGDVACADCSSGKPGDNLVTSLDINMLNAYYGMSGSAIGNVRFLDIGPTTGTSVHDRPVVDGLINFEDLALASINAQPVANGGASRARPAASGSDAVELIVPESAPVGGELAVRVKFAGTGRMQALSVGLSWDPMVVEPIGHSAGDVVLAQGGLVFSPAPGTVDGASFSGAGNGLVGEGDFAIVRFRVKKAGDARIDVARIEGRDVENREFEVPFALSRIQAKAYTTAFAPAMPNPFNQRTTFRFTLAKSGRADLEVYSVDGRRVRTLTSGVREAGEFSLEWDGRDDAGRGLSEGVYFARLVTTQGTHTRVVTYLK